MFALAETWDVVDSLLGKYSSVNTVNNASQCVKDSWSQRLGAFKATTSEPAVDRFINIWNPYNAAINLELARSISTDHPGFDGLRYRDTTQDALAVANYDPDFTKERMRQVFATQTKHGAGCFAFYVHGCHDLAFFPFNTPVRDNPDRSDNTVWQIYTINNLVAETDDFSFLNEVIDFRDGGRASIYEHILLGLKYIYGRRGPRGLPTLHHADWNDCLSIFGDQSAESVMLAMQLVHACKEFQRIAVYVDKKKDIQWCQKVAEELTGILNSSTVWDGKWYLRLLLSNGKTLGSKANSQGRIYLNPQSWSVISGIVDGTDRGKIAMQSVNEMLDTEYGLCILTPPFKGYPEPEDPPLGSNPGVGENGGIFCHANTWAIIAETMLGNGDRAFKYYKQLLPEVIGEKCGQEHYAREPYVYLSSIVGPASDRFGKGGISWLTGTASWMYIAATQYILGIKPGFEGLTVKPCLPSEMTNVNIQRRFRGCLYDITIDNQRRGQIELEVNGQKLGTCTIPIQTANTCNVLCRC